MKKKPLKRRAKEIGLCLFIAGLILGMAGPAIFKAATRTTSGLSAVEIERKILVARRNDRIETGIMVVSTFLTIMGGGLVILGCLGCAVSTKDS